MDDELRDFTDLSDDAVGDDLSEDTTLGKIDEEDDDELGDDEM